MGVQRGRDRLDLGLDDGERARRLPGAARRRAGRRRSSPRPARRRGPCRGCRSRRPRRPAAAVASASRSASATPKPSSPRKTLPIPATRIRAGSTGSTSSGAKKKRCASWAATPRSRPGSSATVTTRWTRALHVLLDRLDDREPPGEREVQDVGAGARAQTHVAAAAQLDAVDGDRLGPGPLELLPAHRAIPSSRTAPCRRISSSCESASVRSRISARLRIGRPHLGLLRVGHREDVQDEQLVDLAAVEQVAGALGRDPRLVLEDDRRGEHGAVAVDQHRPQPLVAARGGRRLQALRRVGLGDERARPGAQHGVRRAERAPQRVLAVVAVPRRRVDELDPDPRDTRGDGASRSPGRGRSAPPTSARSSRRPAARPRARRAMSTGHAARALDRHLALDRLVPGEVALAAGLELVDRPPGAEQAGARRRAGSARGRRRGGRSRPSPAGTRCASATVVGVARAVRRRVHAAERPAALVLQRRAAVGPQQVALVEDRVGDRADGIHGYSSSSRASTVSSQPGSACRAR